MIRVPSPARCRSRGARPAPSRGRAGSASPKWPRSRGAAFGSKPSPSSSTRSDGLASSTRSDSVARSRSAVAGDVAERLARDLQRARARPRPAGSRPATSPPSRSIVELRRRCPQQLAGQRARALTGDPRALVRAEPDDERPDVADRRVQPIDRAVDARLGLAGIGLDQLRHVLQRQADRVDALDDPVVEVTADPQPLVDDGEVAGPGGAAARCGWRCRRGPRTSRPAPGPAP